MAAVMIAFLAVFLLIASLGLLLFQREAMQQRIAEAIEPDRKKTNFLGAMRATGLSIGGVVGQFEHVLPKSQAEISIVKQRLVRAGFRNEAAIKVFYGSKVLVPILFCILAAVTRIASLGPMFVYAAALGLGFLTPDFWLSHRIAKRQKSIQRGLPDVLDLLVICIEAGLSLDQATTRTSEELKAAQPALCDELRILVLEQRAGRPRSEAWKHLAERTGAEGLRNLVGVLVQSEQFGTSIAKILRVHSDTLRTKRVQAVEEMAAKTSVKLVFPLVLFIFPALFLVTLGPAVLQMMDSFKTFLNH